MATPTLAPRENATDLATAVLFRLIGLSPGQPADPDDLAAVNQGMGPTFRQLAVLDICMIPDVNNFPAEWFNPLADIVAGELASAFGIEGDAFVRLKNLGLGGTQGVDFGYGAGAQALRQINRSRPTLETLQPLFF